MHLCPAVPRLVLMTGRAIEPAGDILDPLMAGTALIVQGRCRGVMHGPRAVLGLARMANGAIEGQGIHADVAESAIARRRLGGTVMHERRTVDSGGLAAVAGGAVEAASDIIDTGMTAGAITRGRRGGGMVEGRNRLFIDGLGMAAFALLRRRHHNGIGPVINADHVAIEAGHPPGVLGRGRMVNVFGAEGMAAGAAGRFHDGGMAAVAGTIIDIGQPVVTSLGGGIRPPARMAAFTVDDRDDTSVTFGTVTAGRESCGVMLRGGVSGGPAGGSMTALAAAGGDDAGVTAIAAHRNSGVAQQVVVIGTDIGGPGVGGMTVGATAGTGHADVTDGTFLGLGGGGGVVLVTGVAGAPETVAVTAFASAGIDDAGVAGIAAHRNGGVAQQVVMIGTGVAGPGARGMAAGARGHTGQAGMAGTTFDAGGTSHVMVGRTGFAAVVAVLATAQSGHAAVAVGTGTVLREIRLMMLVLGVARAPGSGIVTARAAGDNRQGGMTGGTIPGLGRGRVVMLVTSVAVGPRGMATFTAAHRRQGGMAIDTGLAIDSGEIVMSIAGFPLVASLTAFGADHARMASGTGAVLRGGGGVMLITGAAGAPGTGAVAIVATFRGGDSAMAGIAVDRYGRIAQQIVMIGTDIDGPAFGGMAAGAGSRGGQTGMASAAFDTGGTSHVMMGGTSFAADMAGGAVILRIEGGMTEGTGPLRASGQRMMAATGIPLLRPVGRVVTAHTGGIAARRIAVTAGALQVRFHRHLIVMQIAGFPLVTILAIVFWHDARVTDAAFDARFCGDIVMAGGRFPLVTGMAVLLQGHAGMTSLTLLAGGGGLKMVAGAGVAILAPVFGVVATGAAGHWCHGGMTGIAADILGRGSDMVGGAGVAAVTALATIPPLQGGVAGTTVDGLGGGGFVMGGAQLALMTAGAIAEFTDAGVALGTIAA